MTKNEKRVIGMILMAVGIFMFMRQTRVYSWGWRRSDSVPAVIIVLLVLSVVFYIAFGRKAFRYAAFALLAALLIAIVLNEGDELIGVEMCHDGEELLLGTKKGKAIRFAERHVRSMGRVSHGVRSMRLDEGDEVTDLCVIEEGAHVMSITENGYGKRTDPEAYRETGRGGKGVIAMTLTEKTGDLVAQLMVHPDEDILLITDDGTIIRTPVEDIRICGRATQGVRLMRVNEGSRIVGVARAEKEEEAAEEIPGGETELNAEKLSSDAEIENVPDTNG